MLVMLKTTSDVVTVRLGDDTTRRRPLLPKWERSII
jgi:hypothetical protein